jgi:clathrin heavy chain
MPESTDADDVSVTVKAFLTADLPIELIELLEKIILEPSPFRENKNLQNLLLLTAVRSDKGKVIGYIQKLANYDVAEIARIAVEHGLYEEAFSIYKKYEQHALAIDVLVDKIVSIDRGLEYANKIGKPEVWSRLAKAQLDGLRVKDAIGETSLVFSECSSSLHTRQTHISRPRIPRTLSKLSRLRAVRVSTTTSFGTCKWPGGLFVNPR